MVVEQSFATLYLLDFGDYIKLGYSNSFKKRIYDIGRKSEKEIDFESSLYWKVSMSVGLALESSLLTKYDKHVIRGHELSKKEVLSSVVKDDIRRDIEDFTKLFELVIVERQLSDLFIGLYDTKLDAHDDDRFLLFYTRLWKKRNIELQTQ